jgi:hypothetical protein
MALNKFTVIALTQQIHEMLAIWEDDKKIPTKMWLELKTKTGNFAREWDRHETEERERQKQAKVS